MNSKKLHLLWIDHSDSEVFQTNLPSLRFKSEDTLATMTHSEVTGSAIHGNRLKVDYRADGWEGTYTLDINLEEDIIIGGEFWNNGEGKRTLHANLYGRCFRNKSEIVILGTYRHLEDVIASHSFILRLEVAETSHS